jgi:OOP family OmpA-OmpF porin
VRATLGLLLLSLLLAVTGASPGAAADPFARGWSLDPATSTLRFQSVKNETKVEQSSFAAIAGAIEEDGTATLRVSLDSVNTGVDLRNVRMRFLFFETYQFPEAVVTTRIDPALLADLPQVRRKHVPLTFTLDLHGVKKETQTTVVVTLLSDDLVSVASDAPISIAAADHNLELGVTKLEEAAGVSLIPSATVSFDFTFRRRGSAPPPALEVAALPGDGASQARAYGAAVSPASTALETAGDFDREACLGRFEILSKTDSIYFSSGSAALDERSEPILRTVLDIVGRCPGMTVEVAGHTDADGSQAVNQSLSELRARAVGEYLTAHGIEPARIRAVGYGEAKPAFPNTAATKWRNRRIEFAVR